MKNAKRPKKSKKVETELETDWEIEQEEEEFSASNEDESDDTYEERVPEISFPVLMNECKTFLRNCWDALSPPIPENDLVNAWYAGIFYGAKKKGTLYLGRITKSFLKEKDGLVHCFEVNCLKLLSAPSNTVLEKLPIHLLPDLSLFNSYNIIAGLLQSVTSVEGRIIPFCIIITTWSKSYMVKSFSINVFENSIKYHIIISWIPWQN